MSKKLSIFLIALSLYTAVPLNVCEERLHAVLTGKAEIEHDKKPDCTGAKKRTRLDERKHHKHRGY